MKTKIIIPNCRACKRVLLFALMFWCFNTCAQDIDFGKSYINVTKGLNGGTVETGDILEIRASIVVRNGRIYNNCGYTDAIPAGTTYIPGTIRILTNEGKIFRQFTDAVPDDPGWISAGTVRINLGFRAGDNPATATTRGRIAANHIPSFYGGTCIMIASFQVQVTAAMGSTISTGGGSITYRLSTSSTTLTHTFPANTIRLYTNYGICPNAVGANSLGTEFNGTFGSGAPQNRGSSGNVPVGYTYATFAAGMPNDYYYGVANNTSNGANFSSTNNWPKPSSRRVFNVWDIIGDHTNATNAFTGNAPGNNSSTTGYMLVVNAAYRIDSAFQQTISGLCPNTYYEISCWMRNICSKCGCDVNGVGATSGSTSYIPTAPGDSSGVYPNITFEIDGIDYYTTGNIRYTGQWVKKGFTFLTGPSQTSFTLKFFNNAPGGGGNDWALDDISVATCSPNLTFTPSNNPVFCLDNVVQIGSNIRSFFNNYTYFQWQRSTNNGVTWANAGGSSSGTPVWNGTAWEYNVSFPQFVGSATDSGMKYRVVVATTPANLANASCSFSENTSVLTLNIIDCTPTLNTQFVSFNGKTDNDGSVLNWTTTEEKSELMFFIERSTDGRTFTVIDSVSSHKNYGNSLNAYTWSEPDRGTKTFYRVKMRNGNNSKYSQTVVLENVLPSVTLKSLANPFNSAIRAELLSSKSGIASLEVIDQNGVVVRKQQLGVNSGMNILEVAAAESFASGVYTLRIVFGETVLVKRLVKQNR